MTLDLSPVRSGWRFLLEGSWMSCSGCSGGSSHSSWCCVFHGSLCTRHGWSHHVISHYIKWQSKEWNSFFQAEPSSQQWSVLWEQRSCSHLFCTTGFEGISSNPPSPELISSHYWNHRAILALEKAEKYRRKTRLYALSSGLSNMNIPGLCCWWAILSPIEIRDFFFHFFGFWGFF